MSKKSSESSRLSHHHQWQMNKKEKQDFVDRFVFTTHFMSDMKLFCEDGHEWTRNEHVINCLRDLNHSVSPGFLSLQYFNSQNKQDNLHSTHNHKRIQQTEIENKGHRQVVSSSSSDACHHLILTTLIDTHLFYSSHLKRDMRSLANPCSCLIIF